MRSLVAAGVSKYTTVALRLALQVVVDVARLFIAVGECAIQRRGVRLSDLNFNALAAQRVIDTIAAAND